MNYMDENISKKSKIISYIILGLSILIIIIGVVLLMGKGDKKTDGGNTEPDKPYNPNDVVLDEFTYAPLKLEASEENLVYSPLSIKYALSMLNEGASGTTKEEIDKLIGNLNLTKYNDIENVLSLANSIFIRD